MKIFFIFLVFLTTTAICQDTVFCHKQDPDGKNFKPFISYPVVNQENGDVALFFRDKYEINGLLLDKNLNYKSIIQGAYSITKFETYLGYIVDSNSYYLFFAGNDIDEFYVSGFNFSSGIHTNGIINLNTRREVYLGSFSYKNKLYVLNMASKSSTLKLYVLENNKSFMVKEFDLSYHDFIFEDHTELSYLMLGNSDSETTKIDNSLPNSLYHSHHNFKVYNYDDKIFLSLDNSTKSTTLISIDLNNYKAEINVFPFKKYELFSNSNSFLYNDILFQIKACKSHMDLTMTNIKTHSELINYHLSLLTDFGINNTPLIHNISNKKEIQEILPKKKFLRNMVNNNLGISVNYTDNLYITVGCYFEPLFSGGGTSSIPGGTMSTPSGNVTFPATTFSSPGSEEKDSFFEYRSKYFTGIFEYETLNHKSGTYKESAYDNIIMFLAKNQRDVSGFEIFRYKENIMLCFYNSHKDEYYIIKWIYR